MEIWQDIPGFEGRYQASNAGQIRSVDRMVRAVSKCGKEFLRPVPGKVLKPGWCREYKIVNLSGSGTIAVHLLVARTFLPPAPTPLHEVNHADGIKAHCESANLEWLTKSGNQIHAVALGLRKQAQRVSDGISYWPSAAQAAFELTGDRRRGGEISRVLRGERAGALNRNWFFA